MPKICLALASLMLFLFAGSSWAQSTGSESAQDAQSSVLFTNVNVFDGMNERLLENANLLVEGNLIKEI